MNDDDWSFKDEKFNLVELDIASWFHLRLF